MRLFLLILVGSASLQACPFASGSYKKIPPKESCRLKTFDQKKLSYRKLEFAALKRYQKQYEKEGFDLQRDLIEFSKIKQPFTKELFVLLSFLDAPPSQLPVKIYSRYVLSLRRLCLLKEAQIDLPDSWKQRVEALCQIHFEMPLDSSLEEASFFEKSLALYEAPQKYNEISVEEMNQFFSTSFQLSPFEKWLSALKRYFRRSFVKEWDPALESLRFSWGHFDDSQKELQVLRMGCPITSKGTKSQIDPLFQTYLKTLQKRGKKHLYINLMNQINPGWEKKASLLLKEFALSQENLEYVSFPYNGPFYQQESLTPLFALSFIEDFKSHLLNNEQGFDFPKALAQDPCFQKGVEKVLHTLHKESFGSKETLTQRERWQFIDLAYAHLFTLILETLKVDSVNWTCRHGIDRAMSAFTLFEALHEEPVARSIKRSLLFSYLPSFLFYSRPMVPYHAVRTLAALEKLEETQKPSPTWIGRFESSMFSF